MERPDEGRMSTEDLAHGGEGRLEDPRAEQQPSAVQPAVAGQPGAEAGQQGSLGAQPGQHPGEPQAQPHPGGEHGVSRELGGAGQEYPGGATEGHPPADAHAQQAPAGGAAAGPVETGQHGAGGGGAATTGSNGAGGAASTPLLSPDDSSGFERRWQDIQVGFVDEPRRSVEDADGLVAEVMKRLAESFAEERKGLEGQWDRGDEVSTEELRVALQRYRSFFERLLTTSI